jgi:hypothetical protein
MNQQTSLNRQVLSESNRFFRRWLGVFLVLLIYDGAIRKWILPSAEQIIFILKDGLIVWLMICGLLQSRKLNTLMPPGVLFLFMIYSAWVILEVGNLTLPNLLVGIWGVKSHLLYSSFIIIIPLAFQHIEDIFKVLLKVYPWVVIPVCSLAFLQLAAPANSFINQQVRGGIEGIAHFGDANLVRVTGTFSYIAGMAVFIQIATLLGITLYLAGFHSSSFLVGLGFVMAALPATGSRSVLAVSMIGAIVLLLSALISRLIGFITALRLLLLLAILTSISLYTQEATWTAFAERTASSRVDENRAITAFTNAFDFIDISGITGFGTGAANYGARALVNDVIPYSWLPVGDRFEEESGRIMLELGMIGWLFSLLMRIAMLVWAASLTIRGGTRAARMAAVLVMPVMAMGVQQGTGVFGASFQPVYYWFCVALLSMAEFEHRWSLRNKQWMPIHEWRRTHAQ